MKQRRREKLLDAAKAAALCLLLLTAFLGGCGRKQEAEESSSEPVSESTANESEAAAREEEKPEPELRVGIRKTYSYLPWEVSDKETSGNLSLFYEPLWYTNEYGRLDLCLAERVSFSEDSRLAEVTLKEGVFFHNGKYFSAEDVIYSFQKIRSAPNPYREAALNILSVEETGFMTVRFRYKSASFTNRELLMFPLVPKDYSDGSLAAGTGPFRMTGEEAPGIIGAVRYDEYHGKLPAVEKARLYVIPEGFSAREAFESGRTNLYYEENIPFGSFLQQPHKKVHRYISQEACFLEFLSGPFSGSLSNRQKAAMAADRSYVLQSAAWGLGRSYELPVDWQAFGTQETPIYEGQADLASLLRPEKTSRMTLCIDKSSYLQKEAARALQSSFSDAGILPVLTESREGADAVLRVERLTLEKSAELLGLDVPFAGEPSLTEVKALQEQMGAVMEEEVPFLFLFFREKGAVTGFGLSGELRPREGYPFAGVENLYYDGT